MLHSTFNTQFPPRAACVGCHIFMGNPPGLAQTVCWGVGCRGEPMSAMRRSHALAVQREGAQRIEQGSGGNGRGVGSGQWVGSGPRKGDIAQTVLAAVASRRAPMPRHALAVRRAGAQSIERGSGGNGRSVRSSQRVGSGLRKGYS